MSQIVRKRNSHGFTLIEVVSAMGLLSLVILLTLPFFTKLSVWSVESENRMLASYQLSRVADDVVTHVALLPETPEVGKREQAWESPTDTEYHYPVTVTVSEHETTNDTVVYIQLKERDGGEKVISESYVLIDRGSTQ